MDMVNPNKHPKKQFVGYNKQSYSINKVCQKDIESRYDFNMRLKTTKHIE